jgi:hypothetical protein
VAWVKEHLKGATPQRKALLKHASRGLIKAGHAPMLAVWGVGRSFKGQAKLVVAPKSVRVGERLELSIALQSSARTAQPLLIDYAVHHVKANGGTTPKVFKGWAITLQSGKSQALRKSHSLREVTTRRYHAGLHLVELLINGRAIAQAPFELQSA